MSNPRHEFNPPGTTDHPLVNLDEEENEGKNHLTPLINPQNAESGEYHKAFKELINALTNLPPEIQGSYLYLTGYAVCRETQELHNEIILGKNKNITVNQLTEILRETKVIVRGNTVHPEGDQGYINALSSYHERYVELRKFPVGELLGAAILILVSAAVIALSGIIAAASLGLLAPISALGFVFGISTAAAAVSLVTGVTGIAGALTSGTMFFSAVSPNPLRKEMNALEAVARQQYVLHS